MYMMELEALNKRSSQASAFSNPNISEHTRDAVLNERSKI